MLQSVLMHHLPMYGRTWHSPIQHTCSHIHCLTSIAELGRAVTPSAMAASAAQAATLNNAHVGIDKQQTLLQQRAVISTVASTNFIATAPLLQPAAPAGRAAPAASAAPTVAPGQQVVQWQSTADSSCLTALPFTQLQSQRFVHHGSICQLGHLHTASTCGCLQSAMLPFSASVTGLQFQPASSSASRGFSTRARDASMQAGGFSTHAQQAGARTAGPVAVAISGGVDSAVAALLLKRAG